MTRANRACIRQHHRTDRQIAMHTAYASRGVITMFLPIKVGDTITIAEADRYCGSGAVTLRVTALPAEHLPSGSDWIQLTGVELADDGREVGERTDLVRTAALS